MAPPRGPRVAICEYCGFEKGKISTTKFREHLQSHQKGSFPCTKCENVFPEKKKFKVLDMERDSHGENLLKCVIDFNTKNL